MRNFVLARHEDETGISGTGIIAEGVEFSDGTVALRWRTALASTAFYASVEDVQAIHGHGGKTEVNFEERFGRDHIIRYIGLAGVIREACDQIRNLAEIAYGVGSPRATRTCEAADSLYRRMLGLIPTAGRQKCDS